MLGLRGADRMTTNQTLVLICLCLLVSFDALHLASGQAYHFSKGWMPGRKRSYDGIINSLYDTDSSSSSSSSSDLKASNGAAAANCQVRPRIKEMIAQLVKDELRRLEEDCSESNLGGGGGGGGGRAERMFQDIFIKRRSLPVTNWQSFSTSDD